MTQTRLAAARVLLALARESTTLSREIETARATVEDGRDRALLLELVAGTLRWRNELDAIILVASRRPKRDLDPRVLATLRLGVYQLLHLDRIPPHAVVHESVDLIRALKQPHAAGFVNAVLRAATRLKTADHLPRRPADIDDRDACLAYLSITLSHPRWLVARWLERYGFGHTEALCRYGNSPPELTVRAVSGSVADLGSRLEAAGIDFRPGRFVTGCLRLPAGSLSGVPPDLRNAMFVQDEGSQLVAETVPATPGCLVLDACAAPGGKTLALADRLGETGRLVASDFRRGRLALLKETLAANGRQVPLVRLDATRAWPFGAVFDAVLLDVPCSGLGTIRRDPDLKWTRSADDLARFAALQLSMLRSAASSLKPGGAVVYATCSSEPDENIAVVEAFLDANESFALVRAVHGPGVREVESLIDARGCLVTDPVRHGLDAFFAAVLVLRQ
jgi:16S rRNA (cytosine967-C5)-methyltransferase